MSFGIKIHFCQCPGVFFLKVIQCPGVRQKLPRGKLLPTVPCKHRDIRGRDQGEDERLLQDGQDGGVQHSEREEAHPRRNMSAMVIKRFLKAADKLFIFIVQVPAKL